jgi:hypothetical protein
MHCTQSYRVEFGSKCLISHAYGARHVVPSLHPSFCSRFVHDVPLLPRSQHRCVGARLAPGVATSCVYWCCFCILYLELVVRHDSNGNETYAHHLPLLIFTFTLHTNTTQMSSPNQATSPIRPTASVAGHFGPTTKKSLEEKTNGESAEENRHQINHQLDIT